MMATLVMMEPIAKEMAAAPSWSSGPVALAEEQLEATSRMLVSLDEHDRPAACGKVRPLSVTLVMSSSGGYLGPRAGDDGKVEESSRSSSGHERYQLVGFEMGGASGSLQSSAVKHQSRRRRRQLVTVGIIPLANLNADGSCGLKRSTDH